MASCRCPMCDAPCIIKIIATEDERYREVDVCKMCGAMYPRQRTPASRPVAARIVPGKSPPGRGKARPKKKAKTRGGRPKPRKKPVRKARKRSASRR